MEVSASNKGASTEVGIAVSKKQNEQLKKVVGTIISSIDAVPKAAESGNNPPPAAGKGGRVNTIA